MVIAMQLLASLIRPQTPVAIIHLSQESYKYKTIDYIIYYHSFSIFGGLGAVIVQKMGQVRYGRF